MFQLATLADWWDVTADPKFNSLRATPPTTALYGPSLLKCIGTAFVANMFKTYRPQRSLEFGHGTVAPLFDWFGDTCEMWGIEDASPYFGQNKLEEFRALHMRKSNAKFVNGYLGPQAKEIPDGYFDLIYSISVVEHIPYEAIGDVVNKIASSLRLGGVSANSYDMCYDQSEAMIKRLFDAHVEAGLKWIKPDSSPKLDWNCRNVCFEDQRTVLNWYMHQVEEKAKVATWPGNFVTVLIAARK